jgi:hypothetical protein
VVAGKEEKNERQIKNLGTWNDWSNWMSYFKLLGLDKMSDLYKAVMNVLQGMMFGVMFLGQMQDGWVFHPYRTPAFFMTILMIVLINWPHKMGA